MSDVTECSILSLFARFILEPGATVSGCPKAMFAMVIVGPLATSVALASLDDPLAVAVP